MPARSYSVNVQAGAGDTTIYLPASVGISARAAGSPVTLDLPVQHAIGDLTLIAE